MQNTKQKEWLSILADQLWLRHQYDVFIKMILNILSEGNISVIIRGISKTFCLHFILPVLKKNSEKNQYR